MALYLNIAGSTCMILFLLLLVWRGLWQLGWLPRALACPFAPHEQAPLCKNATDARAMPAPLASIPKAKARVQSEAPCTLAEGVFWFFCAIVLSLFFVWVGFQCSGAQEYNSFLPYFFSRFTTAGDGEHYQYIAENWYATMGDAINLIVFYPLYPFCIKILRLFSGNYLSSALVGLIFSQICWGYAAVCLRRLAGRLYPPHLAQFAPLAMVLFPFSFFSLGVFTESLFLLLTILAMDGIVTKRFAQVGVWGFLAALCRTQGVVLIVAAVYAWLAAHPGKLARQKWRSALPLALIPLGYFVYLGLNWLYCGDPLAFLYYQSIAPWYQSVDWIGNNLAQQWGMAVAYPGLAKYIYLPEIALYFVAMCLLLYGVLAGVPMPVLLYGGAYIGASYLSNWLISGSRYVFGCAALYLVVAHIKQPKIRVLLLVLEGAFLVYYACCYMQGQAIM